MRINNNMAAVVTNNQLLGTEGALADVMEKLSSGLNINHASDNPSGIAIAGKMRAQIEGLDQASNNSNDGISVLQTAEGALSEVTDMLQRMRELAVQAANGTNAESERKSIQMEIESLREEIDRISSTTEFNTITLLDGSLDNRTYAEHCSRIQTSNSVWAGTYSLYIEQCAKKAIYTQNTKDTNGEYNVTDTETYIYSDNRTVTGTGYTVDAHRIPGVVAGQTYEDYIDAQSTYLRTYTDTGTTNAAGEPIYSDSDGTPTQGLAYGGTVSIGNESVTLTQNMSGADVKAALTTLATNANVYIEEKNGLIQFKSGTLGEEGYVDLKFTCAVGGRNEEFAKALGFGSALSKDPGVLRKAEDVQYVEKSSKEEVTYHGLLPKVTADDPMSFLDYIDNQRYYSTIKKTDDEGKTTTSETSVENGLSFDGSITINGYTVSIDQGSTGEQVYEKLRQCAEMGNVSISEKEGLLTFKSEKYGANATIDIKFSSVAFAKALGFAESTLAVDDEGNAVGSKSVVGTDAVVDLLQKGETVIDRTTGMQKVDANGNPVVNESQFGPKSTTSYDSNKVIITDVNGFEMSFLAEEDYEGEINLNVTDIGSMTLQVGANEGQKIEVRIRNTSSEALYIDKVDVTKVDGPEDAMNSLGDALSYITSIRSQLGAYENRLEHTTKSIDATSENMTSAISRIEDADMATTMVEYTRLNVLAQASTSALAQANELPQLALQLLQN